ncbi:hypothetical protein [Roseateles koreensis]|uniref:Uncharacterized protein n=1 Tax=Roseateles koreensis TaxID=2987526 RepID=A0ABT5KQR4_9BURK|nr:hypothetical protein [Roseateles koreensis]MDC8784221.1 hypothetical protein [Roseateles koreensis]
MVSFRPEFNATRNQLFDCSGWAYFQERAAIFDLPRSHYRLPLPSKASGDLPAWMPWDALARAASIAQPGSGTPINEEASLAMATNVHGPLARLEF